MRFIDLGDHGEVRVDHLEKVEVVSGYASTWEGQAEALVMNDWAEALGVPHGTVVQGLFWVCSDEQTDDPYSAEWAEYGFDTFEVVELPQQLIEDLAAAVANALEERGLSKEALEDPSIASEVWEEAWRELESGHYSLNWVDLRKQLREVSPGEIEARAYASVE